MPKGALFDIPGGWWCRSCPESLLMQVRTKPHAFGFHCKGYCSKCGTLLGGPGMWTPKPKDFEPGDELGPIEDEEPSLFGDL